MKNKERKKKIKVKGEKCENFMDIHNDRRLLQAGYNAAYRGKKKESAPYDVVTWETARPSGAFRSGTNDCQSEFAVSFELILSEFPERTPHMLSS